MMGKQQELGDIHVTCGDTDDIVLSEYPGSPASEHAGTTDWYQITNEGAADVVGIIAFPYELADHDKKNVYIERLAGEKTNVSLMGANTIRISATSTIITDILLRQGKRWSAE